eukprot:4753891-Amphidinium_carterae.5
MSLVKSAKAASAIQFRVAVAYRGEVVCVCRALPARWSAQSFPFHSQKPGSEEAGASLWALVLRTCQGRSARAAARRLQSADCLVVGVEAKETCGVLGRLDDSKEFSLIGSLVISPIRGDQATQLKGGASREGNLDDRPAGSA